MTSVFTPQGNITVDSFIAAKEMLCAHWGVVGLAEWMIHKEVERGEVLPVLQPYWGKPLSVYLYFSSREYIPQSIRAFIDYLSNVDLAQAS